jgi:hypothetical protein
MKALAGKQVLTREVKRLTFFERTKRRNEMVDRILRVLSTIFLIGAVVCIILEIIYGDQQNLHYALGFIGGYLITTHFRLGDIRGDIRDIKSDIQDIRREISEVLRRLPSP